VRGTRYTKLECVGRGGSSKVYKVMAPSRKIYALKRIRLTGRDHEAAAGFIDEITLLQRLRGHSNIIQLIDAEVIRGEGLIYMVLEYGDIDLARLLARHEANQREGGATELDENFIRLYWQQMLQARQKAVHTIHEARIVHSDLKPANFLVVEGQLKLIDFGIAKAISSDTTSIAREAQVGTLNYMSPEAILGGATNIRGGPPMKVGRPSDVWSLGCILYQMVYGHTPFSALAFIQKMHAITDPAHRVAMPPLRNSALSDVIRRCLDRNARTRISMQANFPTFIFLRMGLPAGIAFYKQRH
ncbi:kinase-like protein, partial [Coccomyxa subellipsoidea C-169]